MKTGKIIYIVIMTALAIAFNTFLILISDKSIPATYINLGFGNLAFILFLFSNRNFAKIGKKFEFLGYNGVVISGIYLFLSISVGVILSLLKFTTVNIIISLLKLNNVTLTLVCQILLFAIYIIIYFSNVYTDKIIIEQTQEHDDDVAAYRKITYFISLLMEETPETKIKKKIENLYDEIRNSQISRHGISCSEIDSQICQGLSDIEKTLDTDNKENLDEQIKNVKKLIIKRNHLLQSGN